MKELFTKDFFIYIGYRTIAQIFIVLALYYFFLIKEVDYILASIFTILGLVFTALQSRIEPKPKLTTCLDKTNLIVAYFLKVFILLGFIFLVFLFFVEFDSDLLTWFEAVVISFLMMAIGSTVYLYKCKKNNVI